MTAVKRCSACGLVKPANEFHRRRGGPLDRQSYCAACAIAYYEANKPRLLARRAVLRRQRRKNP